MNNLIDTPIWQLTPRQLFALQEEWLKLQRQEEQPAPKTKQWMTLDEASVYLNRAKSTLYKYVNEWAAMGAVSKVGGVLLVNIDKVIAISATPPKKTKRNFRIA